MTRNILAARYLPILKEFACKKTLLAFDFDGTLAPIVSEPDRAEIRCSTRELLRKLVPLYPCIVVSGRSRSDLRSRVRGIGFAEVIGNHGIEPWDAKPAIARRVEAWAALFSRNLKPFPLTMLENKEFSLSIHYRKEPQKQEVIRLVRRLSREISGARFIDGKQVINIVPSGLPDKGLALLREKKRRHCGWAMYVGDDETDESVFALPLRERLLTIRVGAKRSSLASFYIRNQKEIDPLLHLLISLRPPNSNSLVSRRS